MRYLKEIFTQLHSSSSGVALITVLWILALLSAIVAAFSVNAVLHTQMTTALTSMGRGYDIARAGMELWLGQVRADAITKDQGIIMTEIMNYYPGVPVRINEVDVDANCGGGSDDYVEIYNAAPLGSGANIDVGNWKVETGGSSLNFSSGTVLAPGEFAVVSGYYAVPNGGGQVALLDGAGDTVDLFSYSSDPSNGSYQVLPDGWNGYKPAANEQASDPAWVEASCSTGQPNGDGMWIKVGDSSKYEGLDVTQYDENGNVLRNYNFALDDNNPISSDRHFLPLHGDTGTAVLANGIDKVEKYYKNGSDSALVVNMGGTFPNFSDTTMYIEIKVPKPELDTSPWTSWWYSDYMAAHGSTNWSNVNTIPGHSGNNHDYVVRYDTGTTPADNVAKGDSDIANPDPGSWRPSEYTGNAADYRFNNSSDSTGRLYVSEMFDTVLRTSGGNFDRLLLTKARDGYHAAEWLEVYNPTSDTLTFDSLQICDAGKTFTFNVDIAPYSYYILEDNSGDYPHGTPDWTADNNGKAMNTSHTYDGAVVKTVDNASDSYNRVGWYRSDYSASDVTGLSSPNGGNCYAGTPKEYQDGSDLKIARKGYSNSTPEATQDNSSDFKDLGTSSPPYDGYSSGAAGTNIDFVELLHYGPQEITMPDQNEFVEIFNTGDTADPTTMTIQDNIPSSNSYDIVAHPADPGSNPDLAPQQEGVILPEDGSPAALGISTWVNNEEVELYALQKNGNYQFLTDGLSNSQMENLTFNGQTVLSSGSWDPAAPLLRRSREKAILDGPDENSNWPLTGDGGTPGIVSAGDNFSDPWGWGGELFSGVSMYEKVYVPSMETSYQPGDIGYFEMEYIEDEAGKQNLLNPDADSYRYSLSGASGQGRLSSLTGSKASEIVEFAKGNIYGDTWLSPGGFFTNNSSDGNLIAGSISAWEEYRHIFSGWRVGPTQDKININTAPYEALRGIPINSDRSKDPAYITEDMAVAIIEHRSGDGISPNSNGNYVIPDENYTNNNAQPFPSVNDACNLSELQSESNFQCSEFSKHAKISSDGLFRGQVKAVTLRGAGDTLNVTKLDVIVDRQEVESGAGPLEIIYMRKN